MSIDVSQLSDSDLLKFLNLGDQTSAELEPQNLEQPQNVTIPKDLSKASNEEIKNLLTQFTQTDQSFAKRLESAKPKAGFFGSTVAGIAEGATDIAVLGEKIGKFAPNRPEQFVSPAEKDFEILEKLVNGTASFTEILSLTDYDYVPVQFFGPSKKEVETASREALEPATVFQESLPESEGPLSNIFRRGARFATGAAQFLATPAEVLGAGLLGIYGQTAREVGAPEFVATSIELGVPQLAKNLIGKAFKNGKVPKKVNKDIVETAKKLGIERLPASVQTESNAINFLENIAAQSMFGKGAYEELFNEMRVNITERLNNELESLSKRQFSSLAEAGESLQNQFKTAHADARNYSRALYKDAQLNSRGIGVPVGDFMRSLRRTVSELNKSFVSGEKEKSVKSFISSLLKELKKKKSIEGTVPLENLVSQRRSVRSMINYEDVGGAKQLLKGVDNALTKTFERVGRAHPEWYQAQKTADANMQNQALFFRNKLMRSVLFGESPEGIVNAINKPSDIAKLENATKVAGIRPEVRKNLTETINAIKRRKVEDILLNRVTGNDGLFNFSKRDVVPKAQRDFISKLLPKESREVIKNIDKISKVVAEKSQKFANTSRTFANAQDVAFILNGIMGLFSGNPSLFLKSTAPPAAYFIASKTLTNAKMLQNIKNIQNAAIRNRPKEFNEIAARISAELSSILQSNGIDKASIMPAERQE